MKRGPAMSALSRECACVSCRRLLPHGWKPAAGLPAIWLPSIFPLLCLLQGYLPQQLYNLSSKYGTKEQLQHLTWDLNHAGIKPIAGKCRGTVVASPGHTLVMLLLPSFSRALQKASAAHCVMSARWAAQIALANPFAHLLTCLTGCQQTWAAPQVPAFAACRHRDQPPLRRCPGRAGHLELFQVRDTAA